LYFLILPLVVTNLMAKRYYEKIVMDKRGYPQKMYDIIMPTNCYTATAATSIISRAEEIY